MPPNNVFCFFKNVKIISFYAIIFTKTNILTAKKVKRMTKNAVLFTKMHKQKRASTKKLLILFVFNAFILRIKIIYIGG